MDAAVPRVGYKLKYKILKRFTKDLILENAALCDKAEEMQHRILVAQEERKFLWKKLMTFRGGGNLGADDAVVNGSASASSNPEMKKAAARRPAQKPRRKQPGEKKQRPRAKPRPPANANEDEVVDQANTSSL